MYRKVSKLLVLVIVLLLSAGCSTISETDTSSTDSSVDVDANSVHVMLVGRSFSEFMDESNCVAIGEYLSCRDMEKNIEYEFKVKQVLKGDIPADVIRVMQMKGYASLPTSVTSLKIGGRIYEEGKEYILVMCQYDYVFQTELKYKLFPAAPYLPMKNLEESTLYGEPIPELAENSSIEYITELIEQAKKSYEEFGYGFRYSTATDIPTIVEESDIVIKVKVLRITSDVPEDRTSYICSVLEVLKEDSIGELVGRENLEALLLKSSAKVGEEYVFLLNRDDATPLFLASSRNSVFLSTDEEEVKEIEAALGME